jgi:hypothetical protein
MPHKSPAARKAYMDAYRKKYAGKLKNGKHSYWKRQRLQILSHYSSGTLSCACCKENQYEFLSLDHINGGGSKHRKSLGTKYILSYLVKAGFPEGYQVLCHNCNLAKGFYGKCPHQRTPDEKLAAEAQIQELLSQTAKTEA